MRDSVWTADDVDRRVGEVGEQGWVRYGSVARTWKSKDDVSEGL